MTWTYPPRRILVPVDFGEASARALTVAAGLGRHFNARLVVLHVESLDAPPYFTHEQVKALEAQRANARAEAQRFLARFADRHGARDAKSEIADGAPADVILRRAADTDLIVMGTNRRSLAARLWIGSVAERISREATLPVLVVRASDSSEAATYLQALVREAQRRREEIGRGTAETAGS